MPRTRKKGRHGEDEGERWLRSMAKVASVAIMETVLTYPECLA